MHQRLEATCILVVQLEDDHCCVLQGTRCPTCSRCLRTWHSLHWDCGTIIRKAPLVASEAPLDLSTGISFVTKHSAPGAHVYHKLIFTPYILILHAYLYTLRSIIIHGVDGPCVQSWYGLTSR